MRRKTGSTRKRSGRTRVSPQPRHKWRSLEHGSKCEKCGIRVKWTPRGVRKGYKLVIQMPLTRGFVEAEKIPHCTEPSSKKRSRQSTKG